MAEWFVPLKDIGRWIWTPPEVSPGTRAETALFHGTLTPPAGTCRIDLRVSSEGHYALWINDSADPLGRGPARTDRYHRSLDAYCLEISDGDVKPVHVWAQVRWAIGFPEGPLADMFGPTPGFLLIALFLDAKGDVLDRSGSCNNWLARACPLRTLPTPTFSPNYVVNPPEHQNSSAWPRDWRGTVAPTSPGWISAAESADPYFKHDPSRVAIRNSSWLIPREIPHTEYAPILIPEMRQLIPTGMAPLKSLANIHLAPNQSATFRCDMGEYVLAYYRLRLGGPGTRLTVTSSEVLTDGTRKSFDLESDLPLVPAIDTFELDTPQPHTFESTHWRAFRFLELTLTAGPEGGDLDSFALYSTGYPFKPDFAFEASGEAPAVGEAVRQIVDISWRTLKCCTWDTYVDCPYYEQLQYSGDTRIQCLVAYVTTGDRALAAQALRAFDRSRTYEGLTQARYPSSGSQLIIPTFSLIHILMIEDYLLHTGDEQLVAELRPGIAPILNWFDRYTDRKTSLIGYTAYWPYVDWVKGWAWGIPPYAAVSHNAPGFSSPGHRGYSAVMNLFYLLALQATATIYNRIDLGSGNVYTDRAAFLREQIHDTFFDATRELICDVPVDVGREMIGVWSQHAQALAVLADVLFPAEARAALSSALDPENVLRHDEPVNDIEGVKAGKYESRFIAPASFYFLFYVAEALAKLRMGEHLWPLLGPFRDAIARGSTTWPEKFEPSRSECHAWSAWPLYFFARHILGIAPTSPDDERKVVAPLDCPPLSSARGHFQSRRGRVAVEASWRNGVCRVKSSGAEC